METYLPQSSFSKSVAVALLVMIFWQFLCHPWNRNTTCISNDIDPMWTSVIMYIVNVAIVNVASCLCILLIMSWCSKNSFANYGLDNEVSGCYHNSKQVAGTLEYLSERKCPVQPRVSWPEHPTPEDGMENQTSNYTKQKESLTSANNFWRCT